MKTYRLQEVKPLGEIIEELQALTELASFDKTSISNGFIHFWNSGQEPEWIYYSKSQCLETIEQMKKEFLENCLVPEQETLAGKIARLTGLELVGEPMSIQNSNWGVYERN